MLFFTLTVQFSCAFYQTEMSRKVKENVLVVTRIPDRKINKRVKVHIKEIKHSNTN